MDEPLDSRFELRVLEGGGQGARHYLNRTRITLGRLDPNDEPQPGVAAFPEPTVSRVHAVLEWDPRKHQFRLHHRSRTNYTVVNGTQMEQPHLLKSGDRVKLGRLVLEFRQVDPRESHVSAEEDPPAFLGESKAFLLKVLGPQTGELFPLNYTRLLLSRPPTEPTPLPGVYTEGLGEVQAVILQQDDKVHLESPRGERPVVTRTGDGFVLEWVVGTERFALRMGDILICGQSAFLLCDAQAAANHGEVLRDGTDTAVIHPLLPHLKPGHEPVYQGSEVHQLAVLSGALRGSRIWIRPDELRAPLSIGKVGAENPALIEFPDKTAPRMEIEFEKGDRVLVRNADPSERITQNWDLVTAGEESYAVSGDRFVLGRTVLRYENAPIQAVVERHSVRHGENEMPLLRQENTVGYRTECDCRIDDRRLGPTHGVFRVDAEGVLYRHAHKDSSVKVGNAEVRSGQEARLKIGDRLELVAGIEVELIERTLKVNLAEPMLIGPTQAEIEASRGVSS